MKTSLPLLFLIIAACSGSVSSGPKPSSGGILDAQKDIAAGKLMLFEQPLPSPAWHGAYHRALKEKGIEIKVVSHSNAQLTTEEKTYNQTMTAEIDKRFGPDILGKMLKEAQDQHEAKQKKPKE